MRTTKTTLQIVNRPMREIVPAPTPAPVNRSYFVDEGHPARSRCVTIEMPATW